MKTCDVRRLRSGSASAPSDPSLRWLHVPSTASMLFKEDACHTGWVCRLICVFAGHIGLIVLSCAGSVKGSIFLQKNRHFFFKERFNKLNSINTIIKFGPWQPVKFQLISRSWNEMIFYRISELMLSHKFKDTIKNPLIFVPVKKKYDTNWFYRLSHAAFYDRINLLNLSWI